MLALPSQSRGFKEDPLKPVEAFINARYGDRLLEMSNHIREVLKDMTQLRRAREAETVTLATDGPRALLPQNLAREYFSKRRFEKRTLELSSELTLASESRDRLILHALSKQNVASVINALGGKGRHIQGVFGTKTEAVVTERINVTLAKIQGEIELRRSQPNSKNTPRLKFG